MQKILVFILTVLIAIFDHPMVVGIVTFVPFLAFAVWIALRFWPEEYVIMWKLVLQGLLS